MTKGQLKKALDELGPDELEVVNIEAYPKWARLNMVDADPYPVLRSDGRIQLND